jgi:hypothetical protein
VPKPSRLALTTKRPRLDQIANALRHRGRPDDLARVARLGLTLSVATLVRSTTRTQGRTSPRPIHPTPAVVNPRAITAAIVGLAVALSRLSASLRPHAGLAALTAASVEPRAGAYVMARHSARARS